MTRLLLATLLLIGLTGFALAENNRNDQGGNGEPSDGNQNGNRQSGHAPEIDPGSAGTAVALLSGGVMLIRGRRKR